VKQFTAAVAWRAVKAVRTLFREASVPPNADDSKSRRPGFWWSIARIFLVETLVLLALAAAVVAYLNWSSEVSWAEFLAASQQPVPAPYSAVQPVKARSACERRAWSLSGSD